MIVRVDAIAFVKKPVDAEKLGVVLNVSADGGPHWKLLMGYPGWNKLWDGWIKPPAYSHFSPRYNGTLCVAAPCLFDVSDGADPHAAAEEVAEPVPLDCKPAELYENVESWSVDCVAMWLETLGFAELKAAFQGNSIDGTQLRGITLERLADEYGVSDEADRKKIVALADMIIDKDWERKWEEELLHQEQLRTQELLELVEMVVEEGVLIMMQEFLHLSNITLSMDLRIPEEVVEAPLDLLVIPTLECLCLLLLRVVPVLFSSLIQPDK